MIEVSVIHRNGGAEVDEIKKDSDLDQGYFPEGTAHQDVYFKMGYLHFVWDRAKSDKCLKERGFDFRTAAMVFNDDDCLYDRDDFHSEGEERMSALGQPTDNQENAGIGSVPATFIGSVNSVLYVVYTERATEEGEDLYRIISARLATPLEKRVYEESKYQGYDKY